MKEAIILAGGFGTRLQKIVQEVPKPMAPIGEIPFLSFLLNELIQYQYEHIVLSIGYLGHKIKEFYGNRYQSLSISYASEEKPLGTGGAIAYALSFCSEEKVTVMNGDTFFSIDLHAFENAFRKEKTKLTVALRKVNDISRYGSVLFDEKGKITGFTEKNQLSGCGFINGGIYRLNRDFFLKHDFPEVFSFEKDFMEQYAGKEDFYAYPCENYFIDIGIPEDYERAQKELPERVANIIR